MITKDYSMGPRVVRKDYVLWKEGTYLHIHLDLKNNCFCSGVVHKLYNQFEALTVMANDYV